MMGQPEDEPLTTSTCTPEATSPKAGAGDDDLLTEVLARFNMHFWGGWGRRRRPPD